jgi:hypothetical protein
VPTVTLAANALTTLERVKEQGSGIRQVDPTQDMQLTFLINEASAAIMNFPGGGREFKSLLVGSQPRTFRLQRDYQTMGGTIDFGQYDAQSVTAVTVETQPTGGSVVLSSATLQWQPQPVEQWYGVYTSIKIWAPTWSWGVPYIAGIEHTAQVTGVWGFPSVPADVEGACVETVKEWFLAGYADTSSRGIPGETASQAQGPRHDLPWSVQRTLGRYQELMIA